MRRAYCGWRARSLPLGLGSRVVCRDPYAALRIVSNELLKCIGDRGIGMAAPTPGMTRRWTLGVLRQSSVRRIAMWCGYALLACIIGGLLVTLCAVLTLDVETAAWRAAHPPLQVPKREAGTPDRAPRSKAKRERRRVRKDVIL